MTRYEEEYQELVKLCIQHDGTSDRWLPYKKTLKVFFKDRNKAEREKIIKGFELFNVRFMEFDNEFFIDLKSLNCLFFSKPKNNRNQGTMSTLPLIYIAVIRSRGCIVKHRRRNKNSTTKQNREEATLFQTQSSNSYEETSSFDCFCCLNPIK